MNNAQKIRQVINKLDGVSDISTLLDDNSLKVIKEWEDNHHLTCDKSYGFDWNIGPIGTSIWIVCDCGERVDITDYKQW